MNPIELHDAECPWCGSPLVLEIDCSAGDQSYLEDCAVCCQPISIRVHLGEGDEPSLRVLCSRDD